MQCESVMCRYFYIVFIGFILKGKNFPNEYKENDKITLKYLQ